MIFIEVVAYGLHCISCSRAKHSVLCQVNKSHYLCKFYLVVFCKDHGIN